MTKQFELEEAILDCWHVVDDLNTLLEGILDEGISRDKISNVVLGLNELYDLKFKKTFAIFEELISEKH